MKKDKNIFKEQSNKKSYLKYYIFAFSVFIVILAACSAFLLMRSLNFDLSNLVEKNDTEPSTDASESRLYSVAGLSGKSSILFICTDKNNNLDYLFVVTTDFDNRQMAVKALDNDVTAQYNGELLSLAEIYERNFENGLKNAVNNATGITVSKYVKCNPSQIKNIFSLFDDISINVSDTVDYHSESFNLELDKGKQTLSDDYIYKYLLISDDYKRGLIICDIINSVLVPKYSENSYNLFTAFVNSCKTDISVIDHSDSEQNLYAYSNADDKFLPYVMK